MVALVVGESMKILNRKISKYESPLIIAEIGINHGDLKVAKMVLAAAKSGCECIKHQTHFVEDEMTEEAKKFFHLMQIFLFGSDV